MAERRRYASGRTFRRLSAVAEVIDRTQHYYAAGDVFLCCRRLQVHALAEKICSQAADICLYHAGPVLSAVVSPVWLVADERHVRTFFQSACALRVGEPIQALAEDMPCHTLLSCDAGDTNGVVHLCAAYRPRTSYFPRKAEGKGDMVLLGLGGISADI